jgi:hypothetical protein
MNKLKQEFSQTLIVKLENQVGFLMQILMLNKVVKNQVLEVLAVVWVWPAEVWI